MCSFSVLIVYVCIFIGNGKLPRKLLVICWWNWLQDVLWQAGENEDEGYWGVPPWIKHKVDNPGHYFPWPMKKPTVWECGYFTQVNLSFSCWVFFLTKQFFVAYAGRFFPQTTILNDQISTHVHLKSKGLVTEERSKNKLKKNLNLKTDCRKSAKDSVRSLIMLTVWRTSLLTSGKFWPTGMKNVE